MVNVTYGREVQIKPQNVDADFDYWNVLGTTSDDSASGGGLPGMLMCE